MIITNSALRASLVIYYWKPARRSRIIVKKPLQSRFNFSEQMGAYVFSLGESNGTYYISDSFLRENYPESRKV